MKRWALIENNVCVNVVEQADIPQIGGTWLEVTGTSVGPSYTYTNESWTAPAPVAENSFITQYAYWSRWPVAKRQAFKTAAKTTIAFEDFIDMVQLGKWVDLDLPALIAAHEQIVAASALTQNESDAILNAAVTEGERI